MISGLATRRTRTCVVLPSPERLGHAITSHKLSPRRAVAEAELHREDALLGGRLRLPFPVAAWPTPEALYKSVELYLAFSRAHALHGLAPMMSRRCRNSSTIYWFWPVIKYGQRPHRGVIAVRLSARLETTMPGDAMQYKGWDIVPQSRLDPNSARWRPSARVRQSRASRLYLMPPIDAPLTVTQDNEQQANAYAVAMAKKWIDDRNANPR
jgi:hypothetical protein